ncbi:MAG: glycosyltransferase, partial [Syntrophales bacterium LBB04]|nr:glycosyltransferase [Syntrophales bacterium LBB04]
MPVRTPINFLAVNVCFHTCIPSSPSHIRYPKTIFQDETIEKHRPRIDVLHCFNFPIPRFSGKIVMTVHDFRENDLPEFFNPVMNLIRHKVVKNNLSRADSIIAVSDFTLERLLYHYPFCQGKAYRVYHGIREKVNHKADLPRSHPKPYILTVGHMYPYKSLRNLL